MPIELQVTPTQWTARGEAACDVRGRPLRVWGGIVGESARVRVVGEGQNAAYAVFRESASPSPVRRDPSCPKVHTCGGCAFMHMTEDGARSARAAAVRAELDRHGVVAEVTGPAPGPDGELGFRHVAKLMVGFSDHGRIRVGAPGRTTRTIVPIPECEVLAPALREVMIQAAHHIIDLNIAPYDPSNDRGVLRWVVLRGSRATGEVMVTLVAGRRTRELADLAEKIALASPVAGVALHLTQQQGNAIFERDEEGAIRWLSLLGKRNLEEELNGVRYLVGPVDFFQTNPSVAEQLYADVLERLELEEGVPVVDLYCGVGGFALQAARMTGWALGVEDVPSAVAHATEAAHRQKIPAEFLAARVGDALDDLVRRLADRRPVVIVNPARRGLEEGVAEKIAALRPRRVAYISCNPAALAKDLALLSGLGLQTSEVRLFDMFPQTHHVEAVAILDGEAVEEGTRRAPRRRVIGRKEEAP
jgi:23S rRNA (uracil1939-C5)-methyltransferase